MADKLFITGENVKGNLNDSFNFIERVSDQIRSDVELPRDMVNNLYDKVQEVVNQLLIIYGYQEIIENRI